MRPEHRISQNPVWHSSLSGSPPERSLNKGCWCYKSYCLKTLETHLCYCLSQSRNVSLEYTWSWEWTLYQHPYVMTYTGIWDNQLSPQGKLTLKGKPKAPTQRESVMLIISAKRSRSEPSWLMCPYLVFLSASNSQQAPCSAQKGTGCRTRLLSPQDQSCAVLSCG